MPEVRQHRHLLLQFLQSCHVCCVEPLLCWILQTKGKGLRRIKLQAFGDVHVAWVVINWSGSQVTARFASGPTTSKELHTCSSNHFIDPSSRGRQYSRAGIQTQRCQRYLAKCALQLQSLLRCPASHTASNCSISASTSSHSASTWSTSPATEQHQQCVSALPAHCCTVDSLNGRCCFAVEHQTYATAEADAAGWLGQ